MGVWLGPMIVKPKPIIIYPGSSFLTIPYKYTGAATALAAAEGASPTITDGINKSTISLTNRYDDGAGGYKNRSGIALINQGINLKKYTSIIINFDSYNSGHDNAGAYFYVSISNNSFDETRDVYKMISNNDKVSPVQLDVTALSGEYYIGVLLTTGGNYKCTTKVDITGITIIAS